MAIYHLGGQHQLVESSEIAASCRSAVEDVDVPLAEAVGDGLLERDESPDTRRVAFRLTAKGATYAVDGDPPGDTE